MRRVDDAVRRALRPGAVRSELPCLTIVLEVRAEQAAQSHVERRILDWRDGFHPPVEIPLHPIRGPDVELLATAVREVEHSRVLEKSSDDADDSNVLTQTRDAGTQTADTPHDQIDIDAGSRRSIQCIDHLRVHQSIHLRDDASRTSRAGVFSLAVDQV